MSTTPHHEDLARVLAAVLKVQPDKKRAKDFIESEPIAAFSGMTLLQLTAQGRTEAAISYVESIASGFLG
ncbi:MAG: hypothetical protein KGR99_11910 [Betaproteobacteria bacterium]|nr:hypothetical protein [Betaproteobacteria bacterium]MBU6512999.1 hypothetical protein [Betaproteobacteria bacterium]MDE2153150.1 hypothetical protein [Betaproteobacteria bacterium]MDE2478532.1 hypothetical protein [Betaproteobacteria bacterium]